MSLNEMYDHRKLQTWVHRLDYNWIDRRGNIWCGGPTDFTGCIELFKLIDPRVRVVQTYVDGKEDTLYIKQGGEWTARLKR